MNKNTARSAKNKDYLTGMYDGTIFGMRIAVALIEVIIAYTPATNWITRKGLFTARDDILSHLNGWKDKGFNLMGLVNLLEWAGEYMGETEDIQAAREAENNEEGI